MTRAATAHAQPENPHFTMTHTVDAPRELAWAVFTNEKHMRRWWGPKGFRVAHCSMNINPGGIFHYQLEAPDGSTMWGKFIYQRIDAPEQLAFLSMFSDKDGGITRHPFAPDWPQQLSTIITFREAGPAKTDITVDWTPHESSSAAERASFAAALDSMKQGWGGTFEQLDAYLATIRA